MIEVISLPEIHRKAIIISHRIRLIANRVFALIPAEKSFPPAGLPNDRFLQSPVDKLYFFLKKFPSSTPKGDENPISEIIFSPSETQKIQGFAPTGLRSRVDEACIEQIEISESGNVCARIHSDTYSGPECLSTKLGVFPDYLAILEQTENAITLLEEKLRRA